MEGAEQPIKRGQASTIIAFEILVMQVMEMAATIEGQLLPDPQPFEPAMAQGGKECGQMDLKKARLPDEAPAAIATPPLKNR